MPLQAAVNFSQLLDYRFDAECYRPELLAVESRVAALMPRPLESIATVTDGNHVSIAESFSDSGVRYLKGAELSSVFIDDSEPTYIPLELYEQITRAQVSCGDVLLSVIGSVGPVGLVTDKYDLLSCSCKLAVLRPHSISGAMLAAYLLSPTGQALLLRRNRGSVQQGIVLPDIRNFPVPHFSDVLVDKVERVMAAAAADKLRADTSYPEAERELLDRLGWDELQGRPQELSFVSSFTDIASAKRSDAEHFQPRYSRLESRLQLSGCLPLGALIEPVVNGFDCRDWVENGTPYIRVGDVAKCRISDACQQVRLLASEVDKSAEIRSGDVLFTRKGTFGRAAAVTHDNEGWIISSEIMRIRPSANAPICPGYLALYFCSPVGFALVEKFVHGVSNFSISQADVSKLLIYVPRQRNGEVDLAWQRRLAAKVEAATAAKDAARTKLEVAKQLVENALLQ